MTVTTERPDTVRNTVEPVRRALRPAPDLPTLAPKTWLVGHLTESALQSPPWAVERSGRGYIQMGELAYLVAEQATGQQTVEEIARAVSEAQGRPVSAGDVQALIDFVLIPRGVLADPADEPAEEWLGAVDAAEAAEEGPSGLAATGLAATGLAGRQRRGAGPGRRAPGPPREIVVGPRALEAVASVLMWLFWPPAMLVVAGISAAMLFWLFVLHGLAQSVVAVLVQPLLLVPVASLAALAVAVSPLGPMVALYGGGGAIERLRVRPSLLRLRLVVDVDNDYGLSRWARLIVNLSAVYLQLVLALGLCLLGSITGWEWPYLSVALLTLNMLRLLAPFGRPEADRLLSDVLLVPHPLRYAGQWLGRLVPKLAGDGEPLPPLKPWGTATIVAFLVVSVLGVWQVGLAFLWATPTLLTTLAEAILAYLGSLFDAVGSRDPFLFVVSFVKGTVLLLAAFVLAVSVLVGLRRALADLWRWGADSPARRRAVLGGLVISALLLTIFWLPVNLTSPGRVALDEPPRSLVGTPWASLTPSSRGALGDVPR
ncbi:MAG: hypothetical protein IT306_12175 [Chloroflexi bacterium]|nr:hypothetical protein [Chloroflexota bacterium]